MKVRDLMSRPAFAVPPEVPIRDVAAFLCRHRTSGAPGVEEQGRLPGVISESDVVERQRGFDECRRFRHRLGRRASRRAPVPGTMSDYGAVALVCECGIGRLPVPDAVDSSRRMVREDEAAR